jgi:hypothetical protein
MNSKAELVEDARRAAAVEHIESFNKKIGEDIARNQAAIDKLKEGRKDDQGKRRWHRIPWKALARVVDVLEYGAKKYAPDNWRKVSDPHKRYWDAAMRHLIDWQGGELCDKESGLPHLAHAVCDVLFLLAFGEESRDSINHKSGTDP